MQPQSTLTIIVAGLMVTSAVAAGVGTAAFDRSQAGPEETAGESIQAPLPGDWGEEIQTQETSPQTESRNAIDSTEIETATVGRPDQTRSVQPEYDLDPAFMEWQFSEDVIRPGESITNTISVRNDGGSAGPWSAIGGGSGYDLRIDRGPVTDDEPPISIEDHANSGQVAVSIIETNAPIEGGGYLKVTAAIENTGDTRVRQAFEWIVDGDRKATVTTTIEPGETETIDYETYTYPAEHDQELPIRIETDGDSDELTVDVLGVDDLDDDQVAPDSELTVQPGTSLLFEIDSDVGNGSGVEPVWFLDSAFEGQSLGPWFGMYEAHENAHYWIHGFESEGTSEVAAAVSGDEETRRASWTVNVTSDGIAAPTIDAARPAEGSLDGARGETVELELDVSDPDGNLDRVVWWLGHEDVILDVSDVDGATDTASLSVEVGCHACPIIAWVITEDGAITTESVWELNVVEESTEESVEETDDTAEPRVLALVTEADARFAEYTVVADGPIRETDAGYESPTGGEIRGTDVDIRQEGDRWIAEGLSGGGLGDALEIEGSILEIRLDQPDVMWTELDGERRDIDEIIDETENEQPPDRADDTKETDQSTDTAVSWLLALVTEADARFAEYTVVADGPIRETDAGYASPTGGEIRGTDVDIRQENGRWIAEGLSGGGLGDALEIEGAILEIRLDQPAVMWTELDGERMSTDEIVTETADDESRNDVAAKRDGCRTGQYSRMG